MINYFYFFFFFSFFPPHPPSPLSVLVSRFYFGYCAVRQKSIALLYILYSLSFIMNGKHRSLSDFRWSYLFFPLCSFLITGKIFLSNVSDTSQLLLCNSLVPSLYFQQTFTSELRLKKFTSKQTNLLCEFKRFFILYFVQHISKLNILCFVIFSGDMPAFKDHCFDYVFGVWLDGTLR